MFVNEEDQLNEVTYFNQVYPFIPDLRDYYFRQRKGTALFDFYAYDKNGEIFIEVDVKVRDESSTRYSDYFVSKEKVEAMKTYPFRQHFLIYFFKGDNMIKVFRLDMCDLKERNLFFTHKRSGLPTKTKVFCVPAYQSCFEKQLHFGGV